MTPVSRRRKRSGTRTCLCPRRTTVNPRPKDTNEGQEVIHKSQPAPDRTMQQFYMLTVPIEKQGKQNQDGQEAGNKGNQKNYDPKKPQHPKIPVRDSDYGKLSKLATDLIEQVGGAPQQKLAGAVANMQGQQQGAGDAAQRGAINRPARILPHDHRQQPQRRQRRIRRRHRQQFTTVSPTVTGNRPWFSTCTVTVICRWHCCCFCRGAALLQMKMRPVDQCR